MTPQTECVIHRASTSAASRIYELKVVAFARYLGYTIYQSPRSLSYVSDLVEQTSDDPDHYLFVAVSRQKIVGYYYARKQNPRFLLNYIAVAQEARGLGFGQALLDHYEMMAETLGCNVLSLDVFESNLAARHWYERRGYVARESSSLLLLATDRRITAQFELEFAPQDLRDALGQEMSQGFSKLSSKCGQGSVVVGLIANHASKLLSYEGIEPGDALDAINACFWKTRDTLIAPVCRVHEKWKVLDSERITRMEKLI